MSTGNSPPPCDHPSGEKGDQSAYFVAELLRLKNRIDTIFNNVLCDMKPGWDDSIEGFNKAWDIARDIFQEEIGRATQKALGEKAVTDAMIFAYVKAAHGYDVEKGSFLWEVTKRGLEAALMIANQENLLRSQPETALPDDKAVARDMSDLVERLRRGHAGSGVGPRDCKDAADEIERLREQLDKAVANLGRIKKRAFDILAGRIQI